MDTHACRVHIWPLTSYLPLPTRPTHPLARFVLYLFHHPLNSLSSTCYSTFIWNCTPPSFSSTKGKHNLNMISFLLSINFSPHLKTRFYSLFFLVFVRRKGKWRTDHYKQAPRTKQLENMKSRVVVRFSHKGRFNVMTRQTKKMRHYYFFLLFEPHRLLFAIKSILLQVFILIKLFAFHRQDGRRQLLCKQGADDNVADGVNAGVASISEWKLPTGSRAPGSCSRPALFLAQT